MLPPLYQPGEVDDAAYGPPEEEPPALPLPTWMPTTESERESFIAWCLTMLDRMAERQDLEPALQALMEDDDAVGLLREMMDQPAFNEARKLMPLLTFEVFEQYRYGLKKPSSRKPKKVGRKANEKVYAAKMDNARLTLLWREHFGSDRRQGQPGRLEILQRRHELTDSERETVENYLFKLK